MIIRKLMNKRVFSSLSFLSFITFFSFLFAPLVSASNYESMGQFYGGFLSSLGRAFVKIMSFNWLKSQDAYISFMRFLMFLFILIVYEELFRYARNNFGNNFPITQRSAVVLSVILSIITIMFIPAGMLAEFGSQYGFVGLVILWLPLFAGVVFLAAKPGLIVGSNVHLQSVVRGIMLIIIGTILLYFGYLAGYASSYWESYTTQAMPAFIPLALFKLFRRREHV